MARLGNMVAARRQEVLGSRDKAATASGVGRMTWVDVEKGTVRKTDYTPAKKAGIMRALGWTVQSWDLILSGGEPESLDGDGADVTRLELLEARFDAFELRMEKLEAGLAAVLARLPLAPVSHRADPLEPPAS